MYVCMCVSVSVCVFGHTRHFALLSLHPLSISITIYSYSFILFLLPQIEHISVSHHQKKVLLSLVHYSLCGALTNFVLNSHSHNKQQFFKQSIQH